MPRGLLLRSKSSMRNTPPEGVGRPAVQYLTMTESVRRLRAAGLNAQPRTVHEWIRQQKVSDIWVLGRHTYIYDEEVETLIQAQRG